MRGGQRFHDYTPEIRPAEIPLPWQARHNDVNPLFVPSLVTRHLSLVTAFWRKRVGVEPTIRLAKSRIAGFEGRDSHRTIFASAQIIRGWLAFLKLLCVTSACGAPTAKDPCFSASLPLCLFASSPLWLLASLPAVSPPFLATSHSSLATAFMPSSPPPLSSAPIPAASDARTPQSTDAPSAPQLFRPPATPASSRA